MGASTVQKQKEPAECLSVPLRSARELVRPLRGGSQPWLARCDDGSYYVVKFRDNPQHVRVLANEMLAGLLAELIRLPVAGQAFVEVPASLAGETGGRAGVHFGSRFPGDPSSILAVEFLPDRLLRSVRNLREAFLGALAFDKWTCNCDGRQFVFYREAKRQGYFARLIDQGFCFNDGDWSFPDSAIRGLYPRRFVYESVSGLDSFEPFLSRIENLRSGQIESCARQIPTDWCDGEPEGPARLAEALFARRRGVRHALIDLKNSELKPFPNWK